MSSESRGRTYEVPEELFNELKYLLRKVGDYCEGSPSPGRALEALEELERIAPSLAPVAPGLFPDRLASEPGDPGHAAWKRIWAAGFKAIVTLDGRSVGREVTIADPRLGFIRRAVLTEGGRLSLQGDRVAEEDLYGEVQILIVPRD